MVGLLFFVIVSEYCTCDCVDFSSDWRRRACEATDSNLEAVNRKQLTYNVKNKENTWNFWIFETHQNKLKKFWSKKIRRQTNRLRSSEARVIEFCWFWFWRSLESSRSVDAYFFCCWAGCEVDDEPGNERDDDEEDDDEEGSAVELADCWRNMNQDSSADVSSFNSRNTHAMLLFLSTDCNQSKTQKQIYIYVSNSNVKRKGQDYSNLPGTRLRHGWDEKAQTWIRWASSKCINAFQRDIQFALQVIMQRLTKWS